MTIKTEVLHFRKIHETRTQEEQYKVFTTSGHRFYTTIEVWKGRRIELDFSPNGKIKDITYWMY